MKREPLWGILWELPQRREVVSRSGARAGGGVGVLAAAGASSPGEGLSARSAADLREFLKSLK